MSEYQVESIKAKRVSNKGNVQYLVKWKNFPESQNTWEPESNLKTCKDMIREFHQRKPAKPTATRSVSFKEPAKVPPKESLSKNKKKAMVAENKHNQSESEARDD